MCSNLGGLGPDMDCSPNVLPGIRYANVGKVYSETHGRFIHFDLHVSNRTVYEPDDASLNGLNGRFARINFACNTQVRRVSW